ncbi:MAG: 50S ribosomal protein L33 [Candidatus Paceibacterota bacterium]
MAKRDKKYIKMKCSECDRINYRLHKSKQMEGKLELKKFCGYCQEHTEHEEK